MACSVLLPLPLVELAGGTKAGSIRDCLIVQGSSVGCFSPRLDPLGVYSPRADCQLQMQLMSGAIKNIQVDLLPSTIRIMVVTELAPPPLYCQIDMAGSTLPFIASFHRKPPCQPVFVW